MRTKKLGNQNNKSFRKNLYIFLLLILTNIAVGDETKWIGVGGLHSWFSSAGCEREVGRTGLLSDQQDGLRWPAQYKWQDTEVAKALWIGAVNYYDPLVNQTFDYKVVHVGPRVLDEDEFIPVEFKMIGRFDHPTVFVDGLPASDLMYDYDEVDELDPMLPADRMIYNVVNTGMGITLTRKIYAFTNQYHDNYFIYDYVFKNTGVCNQDGSITHDQTLEGVVFFLQYRYAPTREACVYGYYWLPQSATWGHSTVNDVLYNHPITGDPFRSHFAWLGLHSQAGYNNIGGSNWLGDGRLGTAQYVGVVTLHADQSPSDPSDDPFQPTTTDYLQSDLPITWNNSQFNAAQMVQEYAQMTAGHPENSHAEDMGCPTPIDCYAYADLYSEGGEGNSGGYTQGQGFGPYTLVPGDSIHIVLAEGVSGLSRELRYTIGDQWLNGTPPFVLPDGSTTTDPDDFKNHWVYTGQDSIFQTFERAIGNYNSGFSIPQPPPPPSVFEVVSGTDKVTLIWDDNAESWSNFAGYRIYRAAGRYDTTYREIFACGLDTDHPEIVASYEDTTVIQDRDYYYYIVSFDDGSTNDIQPGVPLHSSMFWTRTNQPAFLRSGIDADLYVDSNGSDDNSGLTPNEPLRTITAALENIFASSLSPHTIYLAEGTYGPSTNSETYPLNCRSYISLSGDSEPTTILDAEGQANVLFCSDVDHFDIENLTIRNGIAEYGGGIYLESSSPMITNVTIAGHSAGAGGGIYFTDNSNPILINVTISNNTAENGGGLYCDSSSPLLSRASIRHNTANMGGGVLFNNDSNPILNKVIISDNSASWGGGIRLAESSPTLINVTSTGNSSNYFGGIHSVGDCNPVLINSVFWNPTAWEIFIADGSVTISHSDIQGGPSGVMAPSVDWLDGIIDADPLFVDPVSGDFNLQEESPCVDAGTDFFVWEGETLVDIPDTAYNGNAPDMGALESEYIAGIDQDQMIPEQFALYPNYPNPFNPITTLLYDLPRESKVQLVIYDILGRQVRTLVKETQSPGHQLVKWDGKDEFGNSVSSGVYIYRLSALSTNMKKKFVRSHKMLLLK